MYGPASSLGLALRTRLCIAAGVSLRRAMLGCRSLSRISSTATKERILGNGIFTLTKRLIFCNVTTGFPAKWRFWDKGRNSTLGLVSASDWLQSKFLLHYEQSEGPPISGHDTTSVWNFWSRSSDVVARVNQWRLFSQAVLDLVYSPICRYLLIIIVRFLTWIEIGVLNVCGDVLIIGNARHCTY